MNSRSHCLYCGRRIVNHRLSLYLCHVCEMYRRCDDGPVDEINEGIRQRENEAKANEAKPIAASPIASQDQKARDVQPPVLTEDSFSHARTLSKNQ